MQVAFSIEARLPDQELTPLLGEAAPARQWRRVSTKMSRWGELSCAPRHLMIGPITDASELDWIRGVCCHVLEKSNAWLASKGWLVRHALPAWLPTGRSAQEGTASREPRPMERTFEAEVIVHCEEDLEEFEAWFVECFAEGFEGHATLDVCDSEVGGGKQPIVLSTGQLFSEAPIFGKGRRLPLEVSSNQSTVKLSFHSSSQELTQVLQAAPASLRATPGGRRELALLFIESEIEHALHEQGAQGSPFVIEDRGGIANKGLAVIFQSVKEGFADGVASSLNRRWPTIFRL